MQLFNEQSCLFGIDFHKGARLFSYIMSAIYFISMILVAVFTLSWKNLLFPNESVLAGIATTVANTANLPKVEKAVIQKWWSAGPLVETSLVEASLLFLIVLNLLVVYGSYKKEHKYYYPHLVAMVVFITSTVFGAIWSVVYAINLAAFSQNSNISEFFSYIIFALVSVLVGLAYAYFGFYVVNESRKLAMKENLETVGNTVCQQQCA